MLFTCMATTVGRTALRALVAIASSASQVGRSTGPKKEARGPSFAHDRRPDPGFARTIIKSLVPLGQTHSGRPQQTHDFHASYSLRSKNGQFSEYSRTRLSSSRSHLPTTTLSVAQTQP